MKQILTTILFSVGFSLFLQAQNQLVIEVTTDKYASETSWKLFNANDQLIRSRIQFENRTTHYDTVQIPQGQCFYWTIYDQYSDGMSAAEGGDYKIYLDGKVIAQCQQKNFGDSVSVYHLGSQCANNDVKMMSVDVLRYLSLDSANVSFSILNRGSETVENIEAAFSANNIEVFNELIEKVNLQPGEVKKLTFNKEHFFANAGDFTIGVNIAKVNNQVDGFASNNALNKTITIVDGFVRKNMAEVFNSVWCSSCYGDYKGFFNALKKWDGTYSIVSYMVYEEYDKNWFPEVTMLKEFYQAMGLPNLRINFPRIMYDNNFEENYSLMLGKATPIKVDLEAQGTGDSLKIKARIFSNENVTGKLLFRGVVTEKSSTDVGLDNAEYSPYWDIALTMINAFNGFEIDGLTAGQWLEYKYTLPYNSFVLENFHSFNELSILFYVQDKNTREIYQSEQKPFAYNSLPANVLFNLTNLETDVDTTGLSLSVSSDRWLYSAQTGSFIYPDNHITFTSGSVDGSPVPFVFEMDENNKAFSIYPLYGWEGNTSYYLITSNFVTIDGLKIPADTLSFTTGNYTGVNQKESGEFAIFPNPSHGDFSILVPSEGKITIYDSQGKQVYSSSVTEGVNRLNFQQLLPGIYWAEYKSDSTCQNIKILIATK